MSSDNDGFSDFPWQEHLDDAWLVLDEHGRVRAWSKGAERLFGYRHDQACDQLIESLIVAADRCAEQHRFIAETLRDGVGTFETLRRREDGTLIYVDITARLVTPVADGEPVLLFSEKNVTSLKVDRDSKSLEARYRELLESTPDGIVIVNPTGHILIANGQAEHLFGYGPGEMRAAQVEILLPERYRGQHRGHRSHYFDQPRTRAMGVGLELYGLRKDGTEFPVEISLSPLRTEETPLVMSAIRDVSERKRFEKALQDKNLELERANRAKDNFLASMSHELRTPLNAVLGFADTLLMRLPGDLNDAQERQLQIVRSNANHLLSLINDLLNLAKIEAGRVELNPEPVDCQALLREIGASFQPLAESKGLVLQLEVPDVAVELITDRRALSQILINLVGNAIKFTDVGRIGLRLVTEACSSAPGAAASRRRVAFVVEDTGVGMGKDEQALLFEAFVQGHAARTLGGEGTGLGLHLSRKLAELLGGELACESTSGEGSSFVLGLWAD